MVLRKRALTVLLSSTPHIRSPSFTRSRFREQIQFVTLFYAVSSNCCSAVGQGSSLWRAYYLVNLSCFKIPKGA